MKRAAHQRPILPSRSAFAGFRFPPEAIVVVDQYGQVIDVLVRAVA